MFWLDATSFSKFELSLRALFLLAIISPPRQTHGKETPRVLSPSRALNSSPFALLNENKCVALLGSVGTAYIVVYLAYWGLISNRTQGSLACWLFRSEHVSFDPPPLPWLFYLWYGTSSYSIKEKTVACISLFFSEKEKPNSILPLGFMGSGAPFG